MTGKFRLGTYQTLNKLHRKYWQLGQNYPLKNLGFLTLLCVSFLSDWISELVSMRIRVRIQGVNGQKLKKFTAGTFFFNCNFLYPRPPTKTSKLQEKSSAFKRDPALQNMIFLYFYLFFGSFYPPAYGSALQMRIQIQPTKINAYSCRSGSAKLSFLHIRNILLSFHHCLLISSRYI